MVATNKHTKCGARFLRQRRAAGTPPPPRPATEASSRLVSAPQHRRAVRTPDWQRYGRHNNTYQCGARFLAAPPRPPAPRLPPGPRPRPAHHWGKVLARERAVPSQGCVHSWLTTTRFVWTHQRRARSTSDAGERDACPSRPQHAGASVNAEHSECGAFNECLEAVTRCLVGERPPWDVGGPWFGVVGAGRAVGQGRRTGNPATRRATAQSTLQGLVGSDLL